MWTELQLVADINIKFYLHNLYAMLCVSYNRCAQLYLFIFVLA